MANSKGVNENSGADSLLTEAREAFRKISVVGRGKHRGANVGEDPEPRGQRERAASGSQRERKL